MSDANHPNSSDSTATSNTINSTSANRLDLLCDEFERAWIRGESPQIEAYLERCEPSEKVLLLSELILVDRELLIRHGGTASRAGYLRRFPEYAKFIDSLEFSTIDERNRSRKSFQAFATLVGGTKLAKFELLEEVGSGASGAVWKAKDSHLQRTVAIKIPRQASFTAIERERFVREGRAGAQLQHPNIVAVFEVGEDCGHAFIVAEYIEGLNLRDWLKRRRATPTEAAELTALLAEALHHAHEQGVIHRDLKPANVLIDSSGLPHITDFGLAKLNSDAGAMTLEGSILGTPAYMSPEQARGNASQVDRRTDVYGLGALLFEILTGQAPFHGEFAAVCHRVIHDEPIAPRRIDSRIPRDLETICLKAMEKEPTRRYPSAQEMAVDLRRFQRGDPIIARRVGSLEKSWQWIRRRPAVAAAILLPTIVIVAAIAVIKSISEDSLRQQGYQSVQVTTSPSGARVAIVPIDNRTGEPILHAGAVVLPSGTTPLSVLLKPGKYSVEAVIPGDGVSWGIAEVLVTVYSPENLRASEVVRNEYSGHEQPARATEVKIEIAPLSKVASNMVRVPIERQRCEGNHLLPDVIYVDAVETTPVDLRKDFINLETAVALVEQRHKRLGSAAEYDAIVHATASAGTKAMSSEVGGIQNLAGGLAEWTTTKNDTRISAQEGSAAASLSGMRVLKGYGDTDGLRGVLQFGDGELLARPDANSPSIGFRGVLSGTPRFVKP